MPKDLQQVARAKGNLEEEEGTHRDLRSTPIGLSGKPLLFNTSHAGSPPKTGTGGWRTERWMSTWVPKRKELENSGYLIMRKWLSLLCHSHLTWLNSAGLQGTDRLEEGNGGGEGRGYKVQEPMADDVEVHSAASPPIRELEWWNADLRRLRESLLFPFTRPIPRAPPANPRKDWECLLFLPLSQKLIQRQSPCGS